MSAHDRTPDEHGSTTDDTALVPAADAETRPFDDAGAEVDADGRDDADPTTADGSNGRWLSTIGALVLLGGLFLTWYQVTRTNGFSEDTTGWQTFTRLRWFIVAGVVVTIATAVLQQVRALAIVRTVIGVVVSILVLRRVVSPPELASATVTSQLGIYVSMIGGLMLAFGGLLGLGSGHDDEEEDAEFEDREPAAAIAAKSHDADGDVVDADVVETHDRH